MRLAQVQYEKHSRLELAKQLYSEFHSMCFWHCPKDLEITEQRIQFVADGLKKHGGRRGFILSGKLKATSSYKAGS